MSQLDYLNERKAELLKQLNDEIANEKWWNASQRASDLHYLQQRINQQLRYQREDD